MGPQPIALALAGLAAGLQAVKQRSTVSLLPVREFGRGLQENGYGGTNHGSASVALLKGDRIPGTLFGTYPILNSMDASCDLQLSTQSPEPLYRRVLIVGLVGSVLWAIWIR